MAKVKMTREERRAILLEALTLVNSGQAEKGAELFKKNIPAEKFMERALGRQYLEENGYDTSELD
jgi:hypothetical protein